jgi:inner membrane protein
METNHNQLNILERFNLWIQESITIKLVSIGFLVLILLIPASWIQDVMEERQLRAQDAIQEVSGKWSGSQTLAGAMLVIPYKVIDKIERKDGTDYLERIEKYYFLPETLEITGTVSPQILHRGIFDVSVYESSFSIKSIFANPDFAALNIAPELIQWKDAQMIFPVTDLRGISENPKFSVGSKDKSTEPANNIGVSVNKFIREINTDEYAARLLEETGPEFSTSGITAKLNWKSAEDFNGNTLITINLKGSQRINFVPAGKTTQVNLSGEWSNPSFDGEFLPEKREVTDKGFTASWQVLHYNRPFSQQWNTLDEKLSGYDFGIKLLIPVDQYQKSIRTAKYGQLIIFLTFVALFLVEITRKIRIHPFQYILIGVALIIYYTLLLSFSEQLGYNIAYWIATLATVGLVSFYAMSFLKTKSLIIQFTSLMMVFYSFIFVIILQQDFSLLLGSIGLFIIVAALMFFSRKVSWYSNQ